MHNDSDDNLSSKRRRRRKKIRDVMHELKGDLDPRMRAQLRTLKEDCDDPGRHRFSGSDVQYTIVTLVAVWKAIGLEEPAPNTKAPPEIKRKLERRFKEIGKLLHQRGTFLENFDPSFIKALTKNEIAYLQASSARDDVHALRLDLAIIARLKVFERLLGIRLLGPKLLNSFKESVQKLRRIRALSDINIDPDEACYFLNAVRWLMRGIVGQYGTLLRASKIG